MLRWFRLLGPLLPPSPQAAFADDHDIVRLDDNGDSHDWLVLADA